MRIIAGTKRGCRIDAPEGMDTRPTLDRVKESMFGIIQFEIASRRVLDLFAGSGNLGFEALSRGAEHAAFVDASRECERIIRANAERLGFAGQADVYAMDYAGAIARFAESGLKFNLVFLDPPYRKGLVDDAMTRMLGSGVLSSGALVIVEHASSLPQDTPSGFKLKLTRSYGTAAISIFEPEEGQI